MRLIQAIKALMGFQQIQFLCRVGFNFSSSVTVGFLLVVRLGTRSTWWGLGPSRPTRRYTNGWGTMGGCSGNKFNQQLAEGNKKEKNGQHIKNEKHSDGLVKKYRKNIGMCISFKNHVQHPQALHTYISLHLMYLYAASINWSASAIV